MVCLLCSPSQYRAGRRLGISWTPGPRTVAGRGVEVVIAGGLLVVVGFGVGAFLRFLACESCATIEDSGNLFMNSFTIQVV